MRAAFQFVATAAALAACWPASAGKPYYGTIDGATLLHNYVGPPRPRDDPFLKGGDSLNHELARGYLDGIKDATQGTVWCYRGGQPHELSQDITDELAKLSPTELKGPAAPLVMKALRQLYPCDRTQGRSP